MSQGDRFAALRNIALSSVSSYIEYAIFLAAGVLIARSLEPATYGVYAYSVWLGGLLVIVCNHGLTITAIRFCAEARGQGDEKKAMAIAGLLNRWHTLSCIAAFAIFAIVLLLVPPKEWDSDFYFYVALTLIGTLGRATCLMKISIGKGFEQFTIGNIVSVIGSLSSLILVLLLMVMKANTLQFFMAFSCVGLLTGFIATYALRSKGVLNVDHKGIDPVLRKRLVVHTAWTAAVMVLITLGGRTFEMLLLKTYWSTELVGYFAIAGVLSKGVSDLLAGGFDKVLLPLLTRRMQGADSKTTGFFVAEATRYYFFLGMLIAGSGYVAIEGAMALLYGVKYVGASTAVLLSLVIAGVCLMSSAFNAFQISSDNQRDRVRAASITVVVSAAASVSFIPRFGLVGAMISVACTSFVGLGLAIYQVRKSIEYQFPVKAVSALIISCVLAALLGHWVTATVGGKFSFLIGALVFGVTFLVFSSFTRSWSWADYEMIAAIADKVPTVGHKLSGLIRYLKPRFAFDRHKHQLQQ
jgi:O-antigen/teichoic acid export membrane protein